jgi:hypothetical protein
VIFQEIVKPLVEKQLPFIPLRPRTKIAFLPGWEERQLHTLEEAAQFSPDCNAGVVAKAYPDGLCFLDIDFSTEVIVRIEKETGHALPDTYTVRSSPKACHLYFWHSDLSIGVGNLKARNAKGQELWSFRANNQYVVAAFSTHPDTGEPYRVVKDFPIIQIPDWLVRWMVEADKNAPVTLTEPPAAAIRPNTTSEGTAVTSVVSTTGGEILEGGRNIYLFERVASSLRGKGWEYEAILEEVRKRNDRECNPPLSNKEIETLVGSTCRYKKGMSAEEAGNVRLGDRRPGDPIQTEGLADILSTLDLSPSVERPAFPVWVMEGTSLYTNLVAPAVDTSSKYGELIFMPAVQLMLNYLSGKVKVHLQETKLNSFLGEISPYGLFFKSSCCELAHRFYKRMGLCTAFKTSLKNSEGKVVLVQAGSSEGLGKNLSKINCNNAILYNDELQKFVKKASIDKASFSADILTFFGGGDFTNIVSSDRNNFSYEAGTYTFGWCFCTTDRAFTRLWPVLAGLSTGLIDRCFFVISPKEPRKACQYADPELRVEETLDRIQRAVAKEVFPRTAKLDFGDVTPRSFQFGVAFALYFAVDLGKDSIDEECVERAKALVGYRNEVIRFLEPIEGANEEAILQKTMMREIRRNGGMMKYRDLCRDLSYADYGTYRWKTSFKGLTDEGLVKLWEERTDKGRTTRMVGLVREDCIQPKW